MVWNHTCYGTRWCTCSEDVSPKTCHHISTLWHNLRTTVCWHPGGTSPLFCWDVVGVARQPTSSMCFTIWCSLLVLSTRYPHIFCIIIHAEGDLYVFAVDMIIPLILIFKERNGRSSWEQQGIVAFCTCQWNEWMKGLCDLQTWSFQIDGGLGCSFPSDHPKQTGSWVPTCCMNLLSLSLIDLPLKMEIPDFHETLLIT